MISCALCVPLDVYLKTFCYWVLINDEKLLRDKKGNYRKKVKGKVK